MICESCKKEYSTYKYFNCGSFVDSFGRLQTYNVEMYKCVCPYCNYANADVEVAEYDQRIKDSDCE